MDQIPRSTLKLIRKKRTTFISVVAWKQLQNPVTLGRVLSFWEFFFFFFFSPMIAFYHFVDFFPPLNSVHFSAALSWQSVEDYMYCQYLIFCVRIGAY